ncbi:MAG: SHOCT domain-containing protein [Rhodoferax sp.]|nr:SHOCT domain-containing protein [Actinomycetota bacterium]
MMYWGNDVGGAGDWVAMTALMLLFWGGLAALTVWAVRSLGRAPDRDPVGRADTLLAERFARGEIDSAEFTRDRALLHSTAGPGGT